MERESEFTERAVGRERVGAGRDDGGGRRAVGGGG
jgi:hypothetical protein